MSLACPKCHTDNPDTKKYCGDCGTSLDIDLSQTETFEDPYAELKRGYSFCTSEDGERLISNTSEISKGEDMLVNFHDGSAFCRVKDKRKGKAWQ